MEPSLFVRHSKLLVQICLICVLSFDSALSYGLYSRQELRNDVSCPEPRGQFSHPRNCDHYLNCWDGEFVVQKCPGSLLFNAKIKACDWPKNVDCSNKDDTPSPPPQSGPVNAEPIIPPQKPTWKPKPSPPFGQVRPEQPEESTTTTFRPGPTVSFKPKPQHRPENNEPTQSSFPSIPIQPEDQVSSTTVATLNPGGAGGYPTPKPTDQEPGFFPSFPSWPTLKCPIPQGILPVKDHCDTVVVCLSGVGHLLRCPHGHNFDPAIGTCSSNRVGDDCQTAPTWQQENFHQKQFNNKNYNNFHKGNQPSNVQFVYVPQYQIFNTRNF